MVQAVHPCTSPSLRFAALLSPLLLAAGCLGVLAFDEAWLGSQPAETFPSNRMVNLCLSMRLSNGWRASVWWEPAVSPRTGRLRRPFIQPTMACGLIPWQTWLPSSGEAETSE